MYYRLLFLLIFVFPQVRLAKKCKRLSGNLTTTGLLFAENGILYPIGNYEIVDDDKYRVCDCDSKTCVRKCCPFDQVYYKTNKTCIQTNQTSLQSIFDIPIYDKDFQKTDQNFSFGLKPGFPCASFYRRFIYQVYLTEEGGLYETTNKLVDLTEFQYCFEMVYGETNLSALICPVKPEPVSKVEEYEFIVTSVFQVISIIFYIITFLIYALVKQLRNFQGWCVMTALVTLTIAFTSSVFIKLSPQLSDSVCVKTAYIMQFSFLASFFWLNVMCFDLWWTFSGYRSFHGSAKEKERKKFFVYSLYAWGCPLIISLITLAVEYWSVIPKSIIRPGFGVSSCWFDKATKWSVFIYFYLPISIILIANTCMFISTSLIIIKHAKETKVFKRQGSKRHNENEKQRFYVYLKLFIVMGVNWIMEVISWLVGGPDYLWYITDVGNTLQGVLIFFIFVCKKRILRLLNRKICPKYEWFPMKRGSGSTTGTTVASISDTKDSRIRMDSVDLGTNSTPDVHM